HCDGFGAPTDTQLAVDTADLGFNRIGGNHQRQRHLSIGLPCNQQTQHPLLLLREWFGARAWYGPVGWLGQHPVCWSWRGLSGLCKLAFLLLKDRQQARNVGPG